MSAGTGGAGGFAHGADRLGFAGRWGLEPEQVLDLSASIYWKLPVDPRQVLARADLRPYPDIAQRQLRAEAAAHYGCEARHVLEFPGASTAIHALVDWVLHAGYRPVLADPLYLEWQRALDVRGAEADVRMRLEGHRLCALPASVRPQAGQALILANPATPDGVLAAPEALIDLACAYQAAQGLLIVDESFIECAGAQSLIPWIATCANLLVLRSLSKCYGAAGVRLGFLVGPEIIVRSLGDRQPPWQVDAFGASFARCAWSAEPEFSRRMQREVACGRDALQRVLRQVPRVLRLHASAANYLLMEFDTADAAQCFEARLAHAAIMVRNCANFRGLDERFVRVAVPSPQNLQRLYRALNSGST